MPIARRKHATIERRNGRAEVARIIPQDDDEVASVRRCLSATSFSQMTADRDPDHFQGEMFRRLAYNPGGKCFIGCCTTHALACIAVSRERT